MGDPLDAETQVGSLISQAHREKVHGFVENGREQGAEVTTGGEPGDGPGAFYPPTVLAKVESGMTVAQEEIFGPVVTVIPFEDERDAARIANDVRYGLFASVWTRDPARAHRLARQIKAGMIGINMPYTGFPGVPFGGYKQSGFGRELGDRDTRALPRDEERPALDVAEAVQPVRAVAGGRRHTPPPRLRGGYVVRSISLVGGLFLFAVGIVALLESDFGLSPWDVLAQGISFHTPLSFGTASIAIGFVVLAIAWALGQPPWIGTVANAVLIGLFIDALLSVDAIDSLDGQPLAVRIGLLVFGLVPLRGRNRLLHRRGDGSRPARLADAGLSRRTGVRIGIVRAAIELIVLVARHRARRHVRDRDDRLRGAHRADRRGVVRPACPVLARGPGPAGRSRRGLLDPHRRRDRQCGEPLMPRSGRVPTVMVLTGSPPSQT